MRLVGGHSLYVEVEDGRRVVVKPGGHRLNSTSKLVLLTVMSDPLDLAIDS